MSNFLDKLEEERPTYKVELDFNLDDGKPAAVECRDLGPKQWWMIPDSTGLPIIVKQLGETENWDDAEKLKYWQYLTDVCRLAVAKVRDVSEVEGKFTERWLSVVFVEDKAEAGVFDDVLKMTIDQFDSGNNVSKVGQEVLFFRKLRGADEGNGVSGADGGRATRVRKPRKGRKHPAT